MGGVIVKQYRLRDYVFAIITIVVGGQVLFNLAFSLLGLPYAISNNMLPEVFLVLAGYAVLGALVFAMMRYTVNRYLQKDTLISTALTLPLMGILLAVGIVFYESADWLPIAISIVISALYYAFVYIKKASWVYYFAMLYVDILAISVVLFDIQI